MSSKRIHKPNFNVDPFYLSWSNAHNSEVDLPALVNFSFEKAWSSIPVFIFWQLGQWKLLSLSFLHIMPTFITRTTLGDHTIFPIKVKIILSGIKLKNYRDYQPIWVSSYESAMTLYELWNGAKLNRKHLRPWGCSGYIHNAFYKYRKLNSKANKQSLKVMWYTYDKHMEWEIKLHNIDFFRE